MLHQSFSLREGHGDDSPLIYDDAPEGLRHGLPGVLRALGYMKPDMQRTILCGAFRTRPQFEYNWGDANINGEIGELLAKGPWYRFFDALERIPQNVPPAPDPFPTWLLPIARR